MKEIKIHKRKELCQSGIVSYYHTIIRINDKDFECTGDELKLIQDILTHLGYKVVK
jgi:hypothetical protein